jgi:hypothetical protein
MNVDGGSIIGAINQSILYCTAEPVRPFSFPRVCGMASRRDI